MNTIIIIIAAVVGIGVGIALAYTIMRNTLTRNSRNLLKKGGIPDTEKAAAVVIDDLRRGKLGRITFEKPPETTNTEKKDND